MGVGRVDERVGCCGWTSGVDGSESAFFGLCFSG